MGERVDILERLRDLLHQATVERSHYYTGSCVKDAIDEIELLRGKLKESNAACRAFLRELTLTKPQGEA